MQSFLVGYIDFCIPFCFSLTTCMTKKVRRKQSNFLQNHQMLNYVSEIFMYRYLKRNLYHCLASFQICFKYAIMYSPTRLRIFKSLHFCVKKKDKKTCFAFTTFNAMSKTMIYHIFFIKNYKLLLPLYQMKAQ